jgi:hypothetical protein
MEWFDRWFYRKARWCWHRAGIVYPELKAEQDALDDFAQRHMIRESEAISTDSAETSVNMENSIRFNVLSCHGGLVLEVRVWDRKTHEQETKTYLIPDGEPVAERIGQYVTMEMLVR